MRPNRSRKPGFALPAVLAVTGMVTLVFLVAMTALASLNAEAASAVARARFLERALTAEARIAFVTLTEPLGPQGLVVGGIRDMVGGEAGPVLATGPEAQTLRLDGRPYRLADDPMLTVSLQDQAGMTNLAFLDDDAFRRLVAAVGAPTSRSDELAAKFADYVDFDDLVRSGGGEGSAYASGMPPNRSLLRPSEWLSVAGTRDAVSADRWRRLRPSLTSDQTPDVNVNTASSATLQIKFGLSESEVEAVLRAREQTPFLSLQDLVAVIGRPLIYESELVYAFPSSRVIYDIRDGRSAWTYRGRVTLTVADLERPFWIDQLEMLEAPGRAVAQVSNASEFPEPTR